MTSCQTMHEERAQMMLEDIERSRYNRTHSEEAYDSWANEAPTMEHYHEISEGIERLLASLSSKSQKEN